MTAQLSAVVINAQDLDRVREFWSQLLEVTVAREVPGFFVWLKPQAGSGISVAVQKVPDPKPDVRNRLHLDLAVDDREAVRQRVIDLGGSHVEDHEISGFAWSVMADPEGNEFCLGVHSDTAP